MILNKSCSNDSFLIRIVDQLVNAIPRHGMLRFMDAFLGYNQIIMHEIDQENTSFIINLGLYGYKVMLFGLKV